MMSLPELHKVLNHFDSQMATEVLEAHDGMDALSNLKDTAQDDAVDVYMEHIEPFIDEARNIPLRYKLEDIDPFMRDLVDAQPESPASVTSKFGKTMEVIAEQSALPPKGLRGLIEKITKGRASQPSKADFPTAAA